MTTVECIHVFENSRLQSESFTPEAVTAAYVAGLEAMREKAERENPPLLTKEELQQLSKDPAGTPVWVVPLVSRWEDFGTEPEWAVIDHMDGNAYIPGIDHSWWEFKDYGVKWVAYLYRPKKKGGGDDATGEDRPRNG